MQDMLQTGAKLTDAWFDLTIRQVPDAATFDQLKRVFTALNQKRNALVEEALSSDQPSAVIAALPARLKR